MQYIANYSSPLGAITLASDGENLTGLWFAGQKYFAATLSPHSEAQELPIFAQTSEWLDFYFDGRNPGFSLPLGFNNTALRLAVWQVLIQVPYGELITYAEITKRLGLKKGAAQAIGGAVAHNPISIIIPCHRAVGSNGSLTGYAGGIAKKIELLKLEKADMTNLFVPKQGTAL